MRGFIVRILGLLVASVALVAAGYWGVWAWFGQFQPVTVQHNQTEISQLLEAAPWVSEGGGAQAVYVVGYRDDEALGRFRAEQAPGLRAAGVDLRYLAFARPDAGGVAQSTAAERATVAELWMGRDWSLFQRWMDTPSAHWTAAGLAPADGDLTRTAVVQGGRDSVGKLTGWLGQAGVKPRYPLLVWTDGQGVMRACACADARSWAYVRDDLNAGERPAPSLAGTDDAISEDETAGPPPMAYPSLPPAAGAPAVTAASPAPSTAAEPPRTSTPPPSILRPEEAPAARQPRAPVEAPSNASGRAQPAPQRQTAPRRTTPRAAPEAKRQDDATFF